MARPTFVIAGASRSGTTTLHSILSEHPHVFMSSRKEIQFFWRDRLFSKGTAWYERHFAQGKDFGARGEASPPYFHKGMTLDVDGEYRWSPGDDPATRLASLYPDMKLVFSLRSPVMRVYSQFWKNHWQGKEEVETFEEAVDLEMRGVRRPESHGLCWLYRNHYAEHMGHWLSLFPRENVLVLVFEEWIDQPEKGMRAIEEFLGVPHYSIPEDGAPVENRGRSIRAPGLSWLANLGSKISVLNFLGRFLATSKGYPDMTLAMESRLVDYFQEDVRRLQQILGRTFKCWGF